MPGIVGIIGTHLLPDHPAVLRTMLGGLLHEDFYESGTFISEEVGVAVGWASHPGSFSDGMPVWNEDRSVCLVFTGEDYREKAEIDRLRAEGDRRNGQPANYLINLYEELGLKFLERLNGWFSGLIIDLRKAQAFLFNDRYGIGRICYYQQDGKFYFSSEAKSLLKVLPQLRSLDPKSLGEVFSCGSVLENRTLFSGISLLPGGSVWSFWKSRPPERGQYFEPRSWEELPTLDEPDYYQQLKETWQRVLPRYFPATEHTGLSLTGGVDSRMVLAWAPRATGELPCYTFSGRYRDCNDVKLARQLAKLARQPYHTIPVDGIFLSQFALLAEKVAYISEGNLDDPAFIRRLFISPSASFERSTMANRGRTGPFQPLLAVRPSGWVDVVARWPSRIIPGVITWLVPVIHAAA
jgi:asparagine synthase (glutamine-hydrolysing)